MKISSHELKYKKRRNFNEYTPLTVDELKSMPKGNFIVMKTGCYPMKTRLKLFFKWGIQFENAYSIEEKSARKVHYADRCEVEAEIIRAYPPKTALPITIEFDKASENTATDELSLKKRALRTGTKKSS